MQRLELLINQVRAETNTIEWDINSGIPQSEYVRHFRDAQRQISALIIQEHAANFIKEAYFDVIAGQESYAIPTDAHLASSIVSMEYSPDGNLTSFRPVAIGQYKERSTVPGYPRRYILRGGTFLLNPIPQNTVASGLRINYMFKIPDLGIRSGTVASSVIGVNPNTVTSITLANDSTLDPTGFSDADYVTVVDQDGTILMNAPRVTAYNVTTFTLSVASTYRYQTGETLPVGSYVVKGKNTTTQSQLIDLVEDYLLKYASHQILKRESNIDSAEFLQDLKNKSETIIQSYQGAVQDVEGIPIISVDFGFGDMDSPGW